jgi:hypothetical protein
MKKLLLTIFTNNFITALLAIFPMKLGRKACFHIRTGADIRPQKRSRKITASALNPFSELLPNLYYSPIKNFENIFIFKIVRQKRP